MYVRKRSDGFQALVQFSTDYSGERRSLTVDLIVRYIASRRVASRWSYFSFWEQSIEQVRAEFPIRVFRLFSISLFSFRNLLETFQLAVKRFSLQFEQVSARSIRVCMYMFILDKNRSAQEISWILNILSISYFLILICLLFIIIQWKEKERDFYAFGRYRSIQSIVFRSIHFSKHFFRFSVFRENNCIQILNRRKKWEMNSAKCN